MCLGVCLMGLLKSVLRHDRAQPNLMNPETRRPGIYENIYAYVSGNRLVDERPFCISSLFLSCRFSSVALSLSMSPCTILSRPHPAVWQISLASPPDNRLSPSLLESLSADLDTVEGEWRRSGGGVSLNSKERGNHGGAGVLVLASSCQKFFSNGLDYEKAMAVPDFFESESRSANEKFRKPFVASVVNNLVLFADDCRRL